MKYLVTTETEAEELLDEEYPTLKQAQKAYDKKTGFALLHVCGHDMNPPQPCMVPHSKGIRKADIVPEPVEEPPEELPVKEVDHDKVVSDNTTPNA